MPSVPVEILRYTDDHQLGFVECRLVDAAGRAWIFEEKVPLVTATYLDAESTYPQPGAVGWVEPVGDYFECDVPADAVTD